MIENLELRVAEVESQLKQVIEHIPMSVAMFDKEMRYITANQRWIEAYALQSRQLIGVSHYEIFPEIGEDWKAIHKRCLGGEVDINERAPFPRADGKIDWLRWEIRPWYQSDKAIGGLLMYTEVITERVEYKQAELALIAQYRQILDSIEDMILVKGAQSRIIWANDAFRRYYGMSNEELQGIIDAPHAEPDYTQQYIVDDAKVFNSGKPINIEEPVKRFDGLERFFNTLKSPIFDEEGKVIMTVGVSRDITDKKNADAERERLIKELQIANRIAQENSRLKSEFLSTMSHELRTPLNAIEGFTSIMLGNMGVELNPRAQKMVERVSSNSKRLLGLINDFLDLSRIESGRMDILSAPLDSRALVRRWLNEVGVLAESKGIQLLSDIDANLPETIYGDEDALSKIALNLLSNAIKFTHEGAVTLRLFQEAGQLCIAVQDTGIGIPPHAQHYIFDEFRQVDGSSKRKYGGTGLGLAIVNKLAFLMNGQVLVDSEVGKGSTFTLRLPLKTTA